MHNKRTQSDKSPLPAHFAAYAERYHLDFRILLEMKRLRRVFGIYLFDGQF